MTPPSPNQQSRVPKTKFHLSVRKDGIRARKQLRVVFKLPSLKKQEQTSPFLTKVPPEIRLMIYEWVLAPDPIIWFLRKDNLSRAKKHPFPVIDVCQTFRNESMKLYGKWLKADLAFIRKKAVVTKKFEHMGMKFKEEYSSSFCQRRLVKLEAEQRRIRKMEETN